MGMYLSAVNVSAMGDLSVDARHRAVMSLFPERLPGESNVRRASSQILFRWDPRVALVRSAIAPTRRLHTVRTRQEVVPSGQVSLRVSHAGVERSGKVERPSTPERSLQRVLEALSGAVGDVSVLDMTRDTVRGDRRALTIDTIDAIGVVEDHAELERLLREGIGRAKAYGCGMLTVRGLS